MTGDDKAQIWPGLPVACDVCRCSMVPVSQHDGWRLPIHNWDDSDETGPCPGSLGGVDAPSAPVMAERIETHFLAAMPPNVGNG